LPLGTLQFSISQKTPRAFGLLLPLLLLLLFCSMLLEMWGLTTSQLAMI